MFFIIAIYFFIPKRLQKKKKRARSEGERERRLLRGERKGKKGKRREKLPFLFSTQVVGPKKRSALGIFFLREGGEG